MMPLQRIGPPPHQQAQMQQAHPPLTLVPQSAPRPGGSRSETPNVPAVPIQAMFSGQPPNWTAQPAPAVQQQEASTVTNGIGDARDVHESMADTAAAESALTNSLNSSSTPESSNAAPLDIHAHSESNAPTTSSSLPVWGSAAPAPIPSVSTRQRLESERPPESSEDTQSRAEGGTDTNDNPTDDSSKSKGNHASVEELIEDPD